MYKRIIWLRVSTNYRKWLTTEEELLWSAIFIYLGDLYEL